MKSKLTKSEIDILAVLWDRGPSSVRDVHEVLNSKRATGYTTVLKLMQIMAEKGLVTRNADQRAHIYSANAVQAETQRTLVDELAERAFGGSAHRLALHALGTRKSTPEELAEIRAMLQTLEEAQ